MKYNFQFIQITGIISEGNKKCLREPLKWGIYCSSATQGCIKILKVIPLVNGITYKDNAV